LRYVTRPSRVDRRGNMSAACDSVSSPVCSHHHTIVLMLLLLLLLMMMMTSTHRIDVKRQHYR
jgi:uncharacterized membrane protein